MEKNFAVAPSLICLDLCNLESEVKAVERAGADMLHVDVIDGYFSPSMPLGLDTVRRLRTITDLPFDVHLMAREPDFFISELLAIGVERLTVQLETMDHAGHTLSLIRSKGAKAGVALKPATELGRLEYVLNACDIVLLMLINPGFASSAGERQVPFARRKITALREMLTGTGSKAEIELDGRISRQDIELYTGVADVFVAGSTCLDLKALPSSLESLCAMTGAGYDQAKYGGLK